MIENGSAKLAGVISGIEWEAAVAALEASKKIVTAFQREHFSEASSGSTAGPELETQFERLASDAHAAVETLLLLPAPHVGAVALKARLAAEEKVFELVTAEAVALAIAADLERLAA